MRVMFGLGKASRSRLTSLLLFPLALLLYFSLFNRPSSLSSSPSFARRGATPGPKHPEPDRAADLDHDGLPDLAEMRTFNDRESFRRWFTWIAEMQFYKLSDEWNPDQRDCAGLVRFAWREALRGHDRGWYQRMGEGYDPIAPDVTSSLEAEPLREKLFRIAPGVYLSSDVAEGRFSEFADAHNLKLFNSYFVSRDRQRASPGDLLFFHQPWVQKYPFHVMIFLGEPRVANEGARDWVVYHTGASPEDAGAVKKVRLAVLDQHPNKRWRPIQSNPNFLGFYRLRILNQQVTPEE